MSVQSLSEVLKGPLGKLLPELRHEALVLLQHSMRLPSPSGQEGRFTQFIETWAREHGFATDLWETDEALLARFPESGTRHLPLAGRPTLVVKLPGRGAAETLVLNAHADTVPADMGGDPSSEGRDGSKIFGRGACDVKGPLAGALWAMLALRRAYPQGLAGNVILELVPGEEDCVGLGTLTSIVRGYRARGAVVLEPTENFPRCASRGGLRFNIACAGRAVHGTMKWLGRDAIASMRRVLAALETLETRWNDRQADALFGSYPIARPVTVDSVQGGRWQGMVCAQCTCGGYFELLPGDNLAEWQERFERELREILPQDLLAIGFSERYDGHRTEVEDPICEVARRVVEMTGGTGSAIRWNGWAGFNSGCEAGMRFREQRTPTLVWGPGSLAQAHTADESVDFEDVEAFARMLACFAIGYTENNHD